MSDVSGLPHLVWPERRDWWRLAQLFILSALAGFVIARVYPEIITDLVTQLTLHFETELQTTTMFPFIVWNNTKAALMIFYGSVFFGVIAVLSLSINGYLVGMFFGLSLLTMSVPLAALHLIPHAIIEIPAFLLAGSGGIQLFRRLFAHFRQPTDATGTRKVHWHFSAVRRIIWSQTWFFLSVVLPLVFLAAVVEVFVTLPLCQLG